MIAALAIALFCAGTAAPPAAARTVVLVRHGEKGDEPKDPSLSAAGSERAKALAAEVADLKIEAVIVSDTKRARDTAGPAASARGLTPIVVPIAGGLPAHVKAVADAVRAAPSGGAVLVVGHSNTVPAIIAALGGPAVPDLCEKEFASLFVLELPAQGDDVPLIRKSYGAPDPPGAAGCHP